MAIFNWPWFLASNFTDYYQSASSSSSSSSHNVVQRIVLAFSWRRNFRILFSDLPHHCVADVIDISGLRMLSLLWMLLVHVCTVLYYVAGERATPVRATRATFNNHLDFFQIIKSTKTTSMVSTWCKRYWIVAHCRSIRISFYGERTHLTSHIYSKSDWL